MQHKIVPPKKKSKIQHTNLAPLELRWPLNNDSSSWKKQHPFPFRGIFLSFYYSFSRVSLNISTRVTRNFSEKCTLCTIKPASDLHPKHLSPTVLAGNRLEQPQQSPITSTTKAQKIQHVSKDAACCNSKVQLHSSFIILLDLHNLLKSPRVSFTKHVSSVPKSLTFHAILVGSLKNSS